MGNLTMGGSKTLSLSSSSSKTLTPLGFNINITNLEYTNFDLTISYQITGLSRTSNITLSADIGDTSPDYTNVVLSPSVSSGTITITNVLNTFGHGDKIVYLRFEHAGVYSNLASENINIPAYASLTITNTEYFNDYVEVYFSVSTIPTRTNYTTLYYKVDSNPWNSIAISSGFSSSSFNIANFYNNYGSGTKTIYAYLNYLGIDSDTDTDTVVIPTKLAAPIITVTEETSTSVSFTLKNNDTTRAARIYYEIDDINPDLDYVDLAANGTSSVLTKSSAGGTSYIYAQATSSTDVLPASEISEQAFTIIAPSNEITGDISVEVIDGQWIFNVNNIDPIAQSSIDSGNAPLIQLVRYSNRREKSVDPNLRQYTGYPYSLSYTTAKKKPNFPYWFGSWYEDTNKTSGQFNIESFSGANYQSMDLSSWANEVIWRAGLAKRVKDSTPIKIFYDSENYYYQKYAFCLWVNGEPYGFSNTFYVRYHSRSFTNSYNTNYSALDGIINLYN